MADDPDLSLAEWVSLALVVEGVRHGWAIGTLLAPDGELGRVWTLSRALTYRALDRLVDEGLVTRTGQEPGRGRDRTVLAPTRAGRAACRRWLGRPVEHLREVRTELLVKLVLRRRAGLPAEPLLTAQRDRFAPLVDQLVASDTGDDPVALWRRESARAVRRFLDAALHPDHLDATPVSRLRLSARNQVRATVVSVHPGEVMATVKLVLGDGQPITAAVTRESIDELDIAAGDDVLVVVKSTEVMLGRP